MLQSQNTCRVQALDHLVLTVKDIPRTVAFYTKVLGMTEQWFKAADGTERAALLFGASKINLHQAGREFDPKAETPTSGSADLCFLTETEVTDWARHLADQGIPVLEGPVSRSGATGPLLSLYIRDPDGNLIEISTKAP
jgi:catechol 2,3-dioxygenase-like lactoylglutathione lyase family enzyme